MNRLTKLQHASSVFITSVAFTRPLTPLAKAHLDQHRQYHWYTTLQTAHYSAINKWKKTSFSSHKNEVKNRTTVTHTVAPIPWRWPGGTFLAPPEIPGPEHIRDRRTKSISPLPGFPEFLWTPWFSRECWWLPIDPLRERGGRGHTTDRTLLPPPHSSQTGSTEQNKKSNTGWSYQNIRTNHAAIRLTFFSTCGVFKNTENLKCLKSFVQIQRKLSANARWTHAQKTDGKMQYPPEVSASLSKAVCCFQTEWE